MHIGCRFGGNPPSNKDSIAAKVNLPKNQFICKKLKFLQGQLDHPRMHIGCRFGGNPPSNKDSIDAKVDFWQNINI